MSAWWLLLIVPAAFVLGFFFALVALAFDIDKLVGRFRSLEKRNQC